MAAAMTRRSVLAAMGLGLGAALAGCEGDPEPSEGTAGPGPGQPEDPRATPPAGSSPSQPSDTDALLAALSRARDLAVRCRAITGADKAFRALQLQVQAALDSQVGVLDDVLRAGGVAVPEQTGPAASATTSTAGGDVGSTTTAAPGDAAESTSPGDAAESTSRAAASQRAAEDLRGLGRDCLQDVTSAALISLSEVSSANLPMLLAIAGQRGATAHLFGHTPPWEDLTGPTGAAASSLLGAYRPAVYGFEVLAARSRGDERAAYEAVLSPLRGVTRRITQLAGASAPPAPLGYGLPEGTGNPEGRHQLAGELMAALPPTIMGQTKAFTGDPDSVAGSVRLLAEALRLGQPWNPMTGFPGMAVPGA